VALLRRAVEGLAGAADREPIDYSPTLAELGKAVAAVDQRLEALEAWPGFALAPEQLAGLLRRAADAILAAPLGELQRDRAAFDQGLRALGREAEGRLAHRNRMRAALIAGLTGLAAGALVWAALLGPVARTFPEQWLVPERLAAATLAMPRAAAGARLLQSADPDGWRQTVSCAAPAKSKPPKRAGGPRMRS
jgi:hypothetical protein